MAGWDFVETKFIKNGDDYKDNDMSMGWGCGGVGVGVYRYPIEFCVVQYPLLSYVCVPYE